MPIRVLLGDPHQMLREGLRSCLTTDGQIEIVAEAGDGAEAVRLAETVPMDVAVLATTLPRLSGLDAIERIRKDCGYIRCIALSNDGGGSEIERAMQTGASGFVLKTGGCDKLREAIRLVHSGRCYVAPDATQHLVDAFHAGGSAGIVSLTTREREVLQLIAEGGSSKEIAVKLGVSVRTVDSHRSRLMQKLDIHKTASLVRLAIRERLVAA